MVCPLTSNLRRAGLRGHVFIPAHVSGLDRDSVVLVSQVWTVDAGELGSRVGGLGADELTRVLEGIALWLGLPR